VDQSLLSETHLTPAFWSFAVALLALGGFSAQLALGWRGGIRGSTLVGAVALSVACAAAGLAFTVWRSEFAWEIWRLTDFARTVGWSSFVLLLLHVGRSPASSAGSAREPSIGPRSIAIVGVILALALFAVAWTPATAAMISAQTGYAVSLGAAVFGLVCVEQLLRATPGEFRWGIKPLSIGLGGLFVFDLYMYADAVLFGQLDPTTWSAHGAVQACLIPFVAVSTVRNKEWTVDLAISRRVVFHSTTLLGSGLYLLTVAGVGYYIRYFGGNWGAAIQTALLFGALVLLGTLITSGTLRSKLRVFLNKHFFSYRYDYREEWLRFTNLLGEGDPQSNIYQRVVAALADFVESPGGAVWMRRDGAFRQVAQWNAPEIQDLVPADSALPKFLERKAWVVDLHQQEGGSTRYSGPEVPPCLAAWPAAWLAVPLIAGDRLIGFVVLADSRVNLELDWEVLDLLKTSGRQAASFLAQIEAREALLEVQKFAAFSQMSAFVVHDLKNLVAQLALLLKNAERHRDDREFQRDMMDTVRHATERMHRLLAQLRAGESPIEHAKPLDLSVIARRVVQTKSAQHSGIAIEVDGPIAVVGHEDRLEHVVAHLVQNALDATAAEGKILVDVRREGERAVMEIADNGVGMTPEFVQTRLFKPFQTTKRTGMGIGAYESYQYVTGLGGEISVQSRPGRGTRLKVYLPQPARADLSASDLRESV